MLTVLVVRRNIFPSQKNRSKQQKSFWEYKTIPNPKMNFSVISRLRPEWTSWYDNGWDPGLADHSLLHVPAGVGQGLPRAPRQGLPAQRTRLVRQVQVLVRMAAGRPGCGRKGTYFGGTIRKYTLMILCDSISENDNFAEGFHQKDFIQKVVRSLLCTFWKRR